MRAPSNLGTRISAFLFAAYGIFHLYALVGMHLPEAVRKTIHVAVATILILMVVRKTIRLFDAILALATIVGAGYLIVNYESAVLFRIVSIRPHEIVLGVGLLVAVLEAGRRSIGWPLLILVLLASLYVLYGRAIPGLLRFPGLKFAKLIETYYVSPEGILGPIVGISVSLVGGFLLLGALLFRSGVADVYIDLARIISGRLPGGPAHVASVSSALFGTVSGSSVANVMADGVVNIPLMKKSGFDAETAAGIEAVASSGGNLVPPVMGSAAFIMAEVLGISYLRVVTAAIVPTILYYLGFMTAIYSYAIGAGLKPLPKEEIPRFRALAGRLWLVVLPMALLMGLLIQGYSLRRTLFMTCLAVIVIWLYEAIRKKVPLRTFVAQVWHAFAQAGQDIASIAVLLATVNLILAVVGLSGLSLKLSALIAAAAGVGGLAIVGLAVFVVTVILTMGLPLAASYIIGAAISAGTMVAVGVDRFVAHFFVFYIGTLAAITPPVAPAMFVAAQIAEADWFRATVRGLQLGLIVFVLPFIFLYKPQVLMIGETGDIIVAVALALTGTVFLALAMAGHVWRPLHRLERVLMVIMAAVVLFAGYGWGLGSVVSCLAFFTLQYVRDTRKRATVQARGRG